MSALSLIIQREYSSRVRTKAFIFTTLLTPLLFLVVIFLPAYLGGITETKIKNVYVIDHTGKYNHLLEANSEYTFITITEDKREEKMDALLEINKDLSEYPLAATFFSEQQQPPRNLINYINGVLTNAVKADRISKYTAESNIDATIAVELQKLLQSKEHIKVASLRWAENGETSDTLGEAASMTGLVLTFAMFFFIMMYGGLVMQSVVEEKTNRIVEVIISSVRPFHLMMGKIIGVALTGLTQLFVWITIGIVVAGGLSLYMGGTETAELLTNSNGGAQQEMINTLSSPTSEIGVEGANNAEMNQVLSEMNNPKLSSMIAGVSSINWWQIGICFILYFIGGYLLFASLYAMFGSVANDAQEAQQFVTPLMIILLVAFYTGFTASRNPEGDIAFWCSLIPFTSPIVMMVRTPFQIPIWELITSLVILYATVWLMIILAAKIYRTGILMHGKKVNITEIIKWIKYS